MQGSITYLTRDDCHGVSDINLVPRWGIKGGMIYTPRSGISIGLFDNYASKFHDISLLNPGRLNVNPDAGAHHLLSLNIETKLRALLPGQDLPDATLTLYGSNLLDEDIYVPEYTRQGINTLPARSGRGIYLSAELPFM